MKSINFTDPMRVRLCSNIRYCCLALFDGFEKNIYQHPIILSVPPKFSFHIFALRIDDNNHKVIKHNFFEIK